jgi:hypothetical protein
MIRHNNANRNEDGGKSWRLVAGDNCQSRYIIARRFPLVFCDLDPANRSSTRSEPAELSGQDPASQSELALGLSELAAANIDARRIGHEHIGTSDPCRKSGSEHEPVEPATVCRVNV